MGKKIVYILNDCRESYNSFIEGEIYNDRYSENAIQDIIKSLQPLTEQISIGGIKELVELYDSNIHRNEEYFLNFSDGTESNVRKIEAAVLLEMMNANYSGSAPFAISLMANKYYAKKMAMSEKILTPNSLLVDSNNINSFHNFINELIFPLIVKPNTEGSSLGINNNSLCKNKEDVIKTVNNLYTYFEEILIEEYIAGYEVTVFLIGNSGKMLHNEPLVISLKDKILFEHEIIDIETKFKRLRKYYLAEDIFDSALTQKIESLSLKIFDLFKARDYARIDYRIDINHNIYFIEINNSPIISKSSEIGEISKLRNREFQLYIQDLYSAFIQRTSHD